MNEIKHYVYRMAYDIGFAPHVGNDICTLSGCKKTTIECWAKKGSWVIGIGGNDTGKSNKLIYAMEVEENLKYHTFLKKYPEESKYLPPARAGDNVLVSKTFYSFKEGVDLGIGLKQIIFKGRGCKCISSEEIEKLKTFLKTI